MEIESLDKLFVVAWVVFALYMMVLLMVVADLWSGIRKAMKRGEVRSSYGYKRTIDKLARYYNLLIALTVVDCMQMAGVWYLDVYYDYHVPLFPLITMCGSIGIGLIEVKSIFEKAEDKVRNESARIISLFGDIAKHKADPEEIAVKVAEYLREKESNNN